MSAPNLHAAETERLQVAGEWCFIKTPVSPRPGEAVILIHGNGETVEADSSSWERAEGDAALMDALLEGGFLLAQSNHTAVPGNGMWGSPATQQSVLALMDHLRKTQGVEVFHAAAISAGNATLLNLLLDGKAAFRSAVLIAPVVSLESLYRCPAGVDRVSGIAIAFDFQPAHGCPGDPEGDEAFKKATAPHDPLRQSPRDGHLRAGFGPVGHAVDGPLRSRGPEGPPGGEPPALHRAPRARRHRQSASAHRRRTPTPRRICSSPTATRSRGS